MRRRAVVGLFASAAAWALTANAQQPSATRKIGVLMPFKPGDSEGETLAAALRQGLQELDWSEGRIALEFRWSTGDVAQARAYATELVALSPEVIFAFTAGQLSAVARETKTIPLIFVGVSDAVGSGFVASFARPGGNITGFTLFEASLGGKWFEVLREVSSEQLQTLPA